MRRLLPKDMRIAATSGALLLAPAAALLGGCGSETKTVSVKTPPPHHKASAQRKSRTASTTTHTSSTTKTSAEATATGQTTEETTSSRTSTAPAFLEKGKSGSAALAAAVATVEEHGYLPNRTAEYHPQQTLQVLTGSNESLEGEQAFFFVNGKYIGTDTSQPSASISVVSQADTEVVLSYTLYNTAEQPDGHTEVRFQLNNGKLMPLSAIPPAKPRAGVAGRL